MRWLRESDIKRNWFTYISSWLSNHGIVQGRPEAINSIGRFWRHEITIFIATALWQSHAVALIQSRCGSGVSIHPGACGIVGCENGPTVHGNAQNSKRSGGLRPVVGMKPPFPGRGGACITSVRAEHVPQPAEPEDDENEEV